MAHPGIHTPSHGSASFDSRGARVVPPDTDADAHAVQTDVYRRMGGRGRVAVAFRLSEALRRIASAGIRARHPEYSDEEIRLAHARLILGDVLIRAMRPDHELVDP
jgi:hypothetical protein